MTAGYVVVPAGDDDLFAVAAWWEELLLMIAGFQEDLADDEPPLPDPLVGRGAADAVGELVVQIRRNEELAVAPIAPEGRFEHVGLLFVSIDTATRDLVTTGIGAVVDAAAPAGHPLVHDALDAAADIPAPVAPGADVVDAMLQAGRRLAELVALPSDEDTELLRRRIGPDAPDRRVRLSLDEDAALDRVNTRIIGVWHGNDPLAKGLYRGF